MVYKGHEEEIFQINMDFYRRLIPYCKEYGVKIAVENMWQRDKLRKCIVNDTCNTSAEFIRYVDNLDSEYVVACLDLGHVGLPLRDDEAQDMIRALGHDRRFTYTTTIISRICIPFPISEKWIGWKSLRLLLISDTTEILHMRYLPPYSVPQTMDLPQLPQNSWQTWDIIL